MAICVLTLMLIGLYFLPTILAVLRKHRNVVGVVILNFFFGWTLIGWVGALIWSLYQSPTDVPGPKNAGSRYW
ncbi:MAG TPA: superinfection immunity protein [Pyrinomonadaceae bacterium]|nr:superinfection immunity protein [Pyrinomonadaceae bacterium]